LVPFRKHPKFADDPIDISIETVQDFPVTQDVDLLSPVARAESIHNQDLSSNSTIAQVDLRCVGRWNRKRNFWHRARIVQGHYTNRRKSDGVVPEEGEGHHCRNRYVGGPGVGAVVADQRGYATACLKEIGSGRRNPECTDAAIQGVVRVSEKQVYAEVAVVEPVAAVALVAAVMLPFVLS